MSGWLLILTRIVDDFPPDNRPFCDLLVDNWLFACKGKKKYRNSNKHVAEKCKNFVFCFVFIFKVSIVSKVSIANTNNRNFVASIKMPTL